MIKRRKKRKRKIKVMKIVIKFLSKMNPLPKIKKRIHLRNRIMTQTNNHKIKMKIHKPQIKRKVAQKPQTHPTSSHSFKRSKKTN